MALTILINNSLIILFKILKYPHLIYLIIIRMMLLPNIVIYDLELFKFTY